MQTVAGNAQSADLEISAVEHLPEYVIGFPVYVAITVRARSDTAFNRLLFGDLAGLRDSIGVEMISQTGGDVVRALPHPVIEPEAGIYPQRLAPGEARRMLADVSPLIGSQLHEGLYRATFSYLPPKAPVRAAPITLRFRKPTSAEEAMKAAVAGDRTKFPNWAMWSITCPETPVAAAEINSAGPLTLGLLLRHLFCGAEPLHDVNPSTLDALDGLFAPERDTLKAELYHERGDQAAYQRLRSQVLAVTPGLAWWFRMIDEGGAFLKSLSRRPR